MLWSTGASVRGPAHLSDGQPNQDHLGLWGWRHGHIAVVCDGLGSRRLSHVGSRLASLTVRKVLRSGITWDDPKYLVGEIYRTWMGALPITPSQAACTMLMTVCRPNGDTFVAQIGDGLVAYRSEGQFSVLTPPRNGFANQTAALGTNKAWKAWNIATFRLSHPGDGIVMMTDGVSDDLVTERLPSFFHLLHVECRQRSHRQAKRWLHNQLGAWPTPGHSDDKTIGMIFLDQDERTG